MAAVQLLATQGKNYDFHSTTIDCRLLGYMCGATWSVDVASDMGGCYAAN
jgi:hypothetical protein